MRQGVLVAKQAVGREVPALDVEDDMIARRDDLKFGARYV